MFWEERTRKPIPMKVKRRAYERAKGKCEKCGTSLKLNEGDFHHTRDPTVTPRIKTVRFLCPLCHRRYGHKRITRKTETFWGTEKEKKLVRQDVVEIRKPAKKKPKTRRVAIRDFWGDVIGYRTIKTRKPMPPKKENTSSRKTKSKRATKKKTQTKKTTRRRKKRESDEWSLF